MKVTREISNVLIGATGQVWFALQCGHRVKTARSEADLIEKGCPLVAECPACLQEIQAERQMAERPSAKR